MQAFTKLSGVAAPLDRSNVDTDQIIPKQFLKKIERSGFGIHLFHDWRFSDADGKVPIADFLLNRAPYNKASILLARENFGCGSSREHAPWALEDFGIRSIIAPSFADIFYNNCFKNGMLPVILPTGQVDELFEYEAKNPGQSFEIDLPAQLIRRPDGKTYSFEVDAFRKECLLNGWDDIGLSLRHADKISSFEKSYFEKFGYVKV
ncbi:MAG TPA: 3-isopropylmalate dehydratase small subunit [Leptospiraceae bacterium]|nr:3-isopropylmalate dehydratase small subunit [Leptospirales bacterium]HMW60622.1 3-isopropylmalate dehydratase small subunit [Leptospiraceae bacterium]HMX55311.1 3-isopropylmalate dehydratase small subunit [Leptospiraceae bacterium]HMZ37365.1 3-isopropylmalate dehydratase small subunit [Leptospiraceae bacterium]HNE23069.1 3-isopropylmalate dehydratase small subunit [Leptospiraceae bacterium]